MELDFKEKDIHCLDLILKQLVSGKRIDSDSVMIDRILPHTDNINEALLQFKYYSKILKNHCANEYGNDHDGSYSIRSNENTKRFLENGGFEGYYDRWKKFDKIKENKEKNEQEKLKLEINKLKRERWMSYCAFVISIIAFIMSIINWLK